jgi:hypothetical protein
VLGTAILSTFDRLRYGLLMKGFGELHGFNDLKEMAENMRAADYESLGMGPSHYLADIASDLFATVGDTSPKARELISSIVNDNDLVRGGGDEARYDFWGNEIDADPVLLSSSDESEMEGPSFTVPGSEVQSSWEGRLDNIVRGLQRRRKWS